MPQLRATILFIFCTLILIGCDSEIAPYDLTKGDIIGSVVIMDTLNQSVLNPAGVTVRIEGTNYVTISDSNGYWQLNDVPLGTYILDYERADAGRKKVFNVQHVGNGTLYLGSQKLLQRPRVAVDVVLRGFSAEGKAEFTVSISSGILIYAPNRALKAILYLSKDDKIDPMKNVYEYKFISSYSIQDTTGYSVILNKVALLNIGYKSGDKIFVLGTVSLVENFNDYGYYDYFLRKFIYTGLGLNYSPVYSFILP